MTNFDSSIPFIIAIDGPAGSGKTTTAKEVARVLGFVYVDTGAMYRAVALAASRAGVSIRDEESICKQLPTISVAIEMVNGEQQTLLNGENIEAVIRTPDIAKAASDVSKIACVREEMVRLQRTAGLKSSGAVLEGRDIGTVVFPDAALKIYLTADVNSRAERRHRQLKMDGITVERETLQQQIIERDTQDSTREHSPLQQAADAVVVDTTNLTIDEQVNRIVVFARQRMKAGVTT